MRHVCYCFLALGGDIRELKNGHDSFSEAFGEFKQVMSNVVRERIDHIQSYHQCSWGNSNGVSEIECISSSIYIRGKGNLCVEQPIGELDFSIYIPADTL
jgi:hypothetical protein